MDLGGTNLNTTSLFPKTPLFSIGRVMLQIGVLHIGGHGQNSSLNTVYII